MPLKPLGLWLPKQLSSTATTLLMSRRQSRWNQTSPKTDFTTIFSKCWATSMATTWAWRVHLGFVFLSGHDKNMPPILKQFKGAAESVQDEKNFRDKLSCLFDDKHVGHYETANKDFPSHLELKAAIAADKVVTLLVMDIAFLKSGGRRTQRTRTQQTRIWRTLRTRRNILANCVLNFWLHLKRNTLAVLLPRTISRVHVINWWPCGRAGSRPKTTKMALAVTFAVAGMTMKTQRELRLVELLLRRRSTAAREMDGTLLLRKRGFSWAHGGD